MYLLHFRPQNDNDLDGEYVMFVDACPLNPKAKAWRKWTKPGFKLGAMMHMETGIWVKGNSNMLPDHEPMIKGDL